MASEINPSLTPTKSLDNFRFWCQKVLPLVYDDSLSYYEVLGKMVVQLNDVIDDVNADTKNVLTLKDAFLDLQTYVNEFFDDIDQLASYAERAEAAQTAANTSAINASESATNASASSLAAMDARDAAVTAKQAAETSANTASTAATNANTKANEAAQSAITAQTAQASASQSATLAATDRSAAQTAASTATTKANEANTSATNAETSAENAAQSESNAEKLVNNIQENLDNIQQNTQDISDLKTAFNNINYIDKTITDNWCIDSTNGNAVATASWAYATFNVEGLDNETATIKTKLYNGNVAGWVVLLKDGTISASGTTENATITLPENVDVVKISCFKNAMSPENIELNCNYSKQLAHKKEIPNIAPLIEQLYEEKTVLYATYKDVWDKAYLNENGGITLAGSWRTSGFLEITDDNIITYKLSMYTGVYYIAFYDEDKQYINNSAIQSTITNNWQNKYTNGTAVIPNGAKYVKFSFRADNDTLYNDQSVTINYARITALEDNVDKLENKEKITARVLIIGDSYSANSDKWIAPMMQEFSDSSSYISLAVSSATVKDQSNDRTTYPYTSRPASSNTTPNTNTFGCQIAKLKRLMTGTDLDTGETAIYQNESEYPNIIIIQGGENDWKDTSTANYIAQYEDAVENVYYSRWGNVSQGTVYIKPDIETVDRTIFAGAYRYLMDELYALFPKAQYFFTTTSPVAPHQNPVVSLRHDVAEQQRFCANLNCVSVIDWQAESQMSIIVNSISSGDGTQENPYVVTPATQDSTDGLHPTEYGGKKLGKLAAHIINSRFMGLS